MYVLLIVIFYQRSNLSDSDRTNLRGLLDVVISKLKYDASYDFETEGEEEMMFIDFRKQLKVLFDTIAQVVSKYFLQVFIQRFIQFWIYIGPITGVANVTELVNICLGKCFFWAIYERGVST